MRITRRLSLALLISMALNLLLGGMLFTQWLTSDVRSVLERREGLFNLEAARAAVSETYRPVIDAIWDRHFKALRQDVKQMFALRQKFHELLRAEPFDQAAFNATYATLHGRREETRATLWALMGDVATALPPDERKRYFDAGFAGFRPPGGWRRRLFPGDPRGQAPLAGEGNPSEKN